MVKYKTVIPRIARRLLGPLGLLTLVLPGCELDDSGPPIGANVDFHLHLQTWNQNQRLRQMYVNTGHPEYLAQIPNGMTSAAKIVQLLIAAHVNRAVVLSMAYAWGYDGMAVPAEMQALMRAENDFVASECASYPDRLIPFFSVNPLLDWSVAEIDRCYDELQMAGLKLHFNASQVSLKDPAQLQKVQAILAHADVRQIPVILHFSNGRPDFGVTDAEILIREILLPHPNLKLQIAHLGSGGGYDDNAAAVFDAFIAAYAANPALNRANLFFDVSAVVLTESKLGIPPTDSRMFPRITAQIRAWGVDNIRWGSDYFLADTPTNSLAYFKAAVTLSDAEYNTIIQHTYTWPW